MRWHCLEENEAIQDVDDFELRALVAENMDFAMPATLSQQLFRPYFGGGYAAGYYAYLWTQKLQVGDDGYQWFVEQGGLTRERAGVFARRSFPEVTAKIWNACIDNGAVRHLRLCDAYKIAALKHTLRWTRYRQSSLVIAVIAAAGRGKLTAES